MSTSHSADDMETTRKVHSKGLRDIRVCKCHSDNWGIGTVPVKVVKHNGKDIALDACIADLIVRLWDNGVSTLSSCCGHNRTYATIVLGENEENYSSIHQLINDTDGRFVELSQWRRVIC